MKFIKLFLLLSIFAVFSACDSDNPTSSGTWKGDTTIVYNVEYTEKTTVVEKEELSNILESDYKDYFRFNKSFVKAKNLKKGDILLVFGKALRKVVSVAENSNDIRVETEAATLNEAIKNGKIAWDVPCEFNANVVPMVQFKGKEYYPTTQSGNELEWKFDIGAYSYAIEMKMNGAKADVKFEIEKKISGSVKGKFIAEGVIERFRSKSEMEFENSTLSNFNQENNDLRGDLKLSLVVTASGNDNFNQEIPVVFLKYPVMVGPIPVFINVKAQIVINAVVPYDGSSQVTAKFKYDSKTGFKYNGYDFSANANIGPYKIDKDKNQTGASNAIGVNFGIGFPRLEIGVFDELLVPWIQTAFLIGGSYTFMPACQEAKASFIGGYGVDFSFLGFKTSFTKNLWNKEQVLLRAGQCE